MNIITIHIVPTKSIDSVVNWSSCSPVLTHEWQHCTETNKRQHNAPINDHGCFNALPLQPKGPAFDFIQSCWDKRRSWVSYANSIMRFSCSPCFFSLRHTLNSAFKLSFVLLFPAFQMSIGNL